MSRWGTVVKAALGHKKEEGAGDGDQPEGSKNPPSPEPWRHTRPPMRGVKCKGTQ